MGGGGDGRTDGRLATCANLNSWAEGRMPMEGKDHQRFLSCLPSPLCSQPFCPSLPPCPRKGSSHRTGWQCWRCSCRVWPADGSASSRQLHLINWAAVQRRVQCKPCCRLLRGESLAWSGGGWPGWGRGRPPWVLLCGCPISAPKWQERPEEPAFGPSADTCRFHRLVTDQSTKILLIGWQP